MSEQTDFLKDLEIDTKKDVLEAPVAEVEPEKAETPEETEQKAKNRRERRLLEQNQRLREEAIASNARLQGLSEAQKLRETTEEKDFLKVVEPIWGTNTPEAKEATELLKKALQGVHDSAKKEALEEAVQRFESDREKESQAIKEEEKNIDDILDSVEDGYGIDMSNQTDRQGFLTLLEKLSPKDQDGNIVEYADPDATAEMYLKGKEKSSSRAKELSSRSMVRSGTSPESKLQESSVERILRENGII